MRSAAFSPLAIFVLACQASSAFGQYGWPGYGGYASTPGEGYAMGMAAMVRSAGMATLATSKAASNVQDARSKYIDNQVKLSQAYAERNRLIQSERAAKRKPPPSSEQLYRWAQQGLPKALSASQLNPVTGAIAWPVVLRGDSFETYRASTEKFFHEAVATPETFTYDSYNHLQEASGECLADLKSRIKDYRPNDYIQAKKFVESLTCAAQQL